MNKYPSIEKWKKERIFKTIPIAKLTVHGKGCEICRENLKLFKNLISVLWEGQRESFEQYWMRTKQ